MPKRSKDFTAAREAMRRAFVGQGGKRCWDRFLTIERVAQTDPDVALMRDAMMWLTVAKLLNGDRMPDEALPLLYALRWALFDVRSLVDLRLAELREEVERLPEGILDRLVAAHRERERRDQ